MKQSLRLRVIVEKPLAEAIYAVQRGRDQLLAPTVRTEQSITFDFEVLVADPAAHPPRLTGEFAQGPPATRFVYVNSGTYAGQTGTAWARRAKVPLTGLSTALVSAALKKAAVLQATIRGTNKDGGPVCASVPLLSEWTLVGK